MIRQARASEAEKLTDLTFAAKRHWGYPESYFHVWADELTITQPYIRFNDVFVYLLGETVVGYYSLIELSDHMSLAEIPLAAGFWLEHMFILPAHIGQGIGTQLFHHLHQRCRDRGIDSFHVLADPNARGFYERMGCQYLDEYPSTIPERTTPLLKFLVNHQES